jgi:hypothetical protein
MPEMKVKLKPFTVPNYVSSESEARPRQEGFQESPKWHVRDLDVLTLAKLCDQFRKDVFANAGKIDPWEPVGFRDSND